MPKPRKSARRRPRGTGTIFRSKSRGVWVARLPVGRTANGRTVYREISDPSQEKLVKRLAALEPPGPTTTIAEFAVMWVETLDVRLSTAADYRHAVNRFIVPTLGHFKLTSLTAAHVEHASREWLKVNGVNTVRKNLGHLRTMLSAAQRAGLITANPVTNARKPRAKRKQIEPFKPGELSRIIAAAADRTLTRPVALLAACGCRIGEALGANVEDYDRATGTLTIRRTYSKAHGERPPKTERGNRTIRVPEAAQSVLTSAVGTRIKGPLFQRNGKRLAKTSVAYAWFALLKRLNLPYRNMHQLRHSIATAMISSQVPIGDVARYLGDTEATIIKTYLHPTGTDPAAAIEGLLSGSKVGAKTTAKKTA